MYFYNLRIDSLFPQNTSLNSLYVLMKVLYTLVPFIQIKGVNAIFLFNILGGSCLYEVEYII